MKYLGKTENGSDALIREIRNLKMHEALVIRKDPASPVRTRNRGRGIIWKPEDRMGNGYETVY